MTLWMAALGCGLTSAPETESPALDAPPAPVTEGVVVDASELPSGIPVKGTVVQAITFTDARGDNFAVLSQNDNDDLFAYHAVAVERPKGAVQVLRKVQQPRGECPLDYTAEFVAGSLSAHDLDADGLAETSFAYKYACRGDVSPRDYKVLVLEDGDKAILRGAEILVLGEERFGDGAFEPEGFEEAPKLLEHAETLWQAHLVHEMGG
ncbi:MAG: hypothetical protein KTR31_29690 [Myxococcales bacterium]|nr:hypothetical protein [Myxococcales bacterium]